MARWGLIAMLIWMCAAVAQADRVHLVDGAVIEGKAAREGDRVVIEVDSGRIALPADQVVRIEPAATPVQQVERQHAQLAPRDVAGRIALADHCRDHGMSAREDQLLREVIALAPDHAEARARLGYVRHGDAWVSREQSLRAQGLVQHEGRWLTREQVLEIERLRAQAEIAVHQRDKAAAELEAARAELAIRKQAAETAATATAAPPQPPPAAQPAPYYHSALFWPAPDALVHLHDRDWWHRTGASRRRDVDCRDERCDRRPPRKTRDDGRPAWPIVGTRDPFDYLR